MTAKYVQPGHNIDFTNSGDAKIKAGDVVAIGNGCGIAACDIAVGEVGTVALDGVFELPKASGEVSLGAILYWDATNKKVTTTASTHKAIGIAIKAAASGAETALVRLEIALHNAISMPAAVSS